VTDKHNKSRFLFQSLSDCDIVVFLDGVDVLFNDNVEGIKRRLLGMFREMESLHPRGLVSPARLMAPPVKPRARSIVFSAECGCWPQLQYPNAHQVHIR
jgi:hypothetical protein